MIFLLSMLYTKQIVSTHTLDFTYISLRYVFKQYVSLIILHNKKTFSHLFQQTHTQQMTQTYKLMQYLVA